MANEQRDMTWFMENEVEPTDEQSAELALNGYAEVDDGQPVTDPPEETPPAEKADVEKPETSAETSTETPDDKATETESEGVLSQDGKTVIPYKVLRGARDQVNELQGQNAELQARLEELEQQTEQESTPAQEAVSDEITDEVLAAAFEREQGKSLEDFREEYGDEQASLFLNPIKTNLLLQQRLDRIEANESNREAAAVATEAEKIRLAIDGNATLVDWEQNNTAMWEAAKAVDNLLKADETWSNRSYKERFEEVVKRLTGKEPDSIPKTKTAEEIAAEKLAAAGKGNNVPNSLSSVPGGDPAAETMRDQAEGMSETELINTMLDPKKQEELLSSLS